MQEVPYPLVQQSSNKGQFWVEVLGIACKRYQLNANKD